MSALTWITLAFFVASLIATRLLCRTLLVNPLVCFFGVWTVATLMYELNALLGYFVFPVTSYTTLLFTLSFSCLFAGALVGLTPLRGRSLGVLRVGDAQLDMLQAVTRMLLLIFIVGVAWKLLFVTRIEGVPFQHLAKVRAAASAGQFELPFVSRILTLAGYITVLNFGVLLVLRPKLSTAIAVTVVILLALVNDSTVGMRGSTVNTVLLFASTGIVALSAKNGKTNLKHLAGAGAALLVGLLLLTVLLYLRSNSPVSFAGRFFLDNYLTVAGLLPSTSYFIVHPWPAAVPCLWTCYGLYQLIDLPLRNLFGVGVLPSNLLSPSAPIIQSGDWVFNSASYLAYFYADAGVLGVGLLSSLVGYASGRTFARAMIQPTALNIQIATVMMGLVIFTIRGVFTGVVFWGGIAFLIFQERAVKWVTDCRMRTLNNERVAS